MWGRAEIGSGGLLVAIRKDIIVYKMGAFAFQIGRPRIDLNVWYTRKYYLLTVQRFEIFKLF